MLRRYIKNNNFQRVCFSFNETNLIETVKTLPILSKFFYSFYYLLYCGSRISKCDQPKFSKYVHPSKRFSKCAAPIQGPLLLAAAKV